VLRYYPLKIGKNLYLNSLKGALVGVPGGVKETSPPGIKRRRSDVS
jgi:hypothetical protein